MNTYTIRISPAYNSIGEYNFYAETTNPEDTFNKYTCQWMSGVFSSPVHYLFEMFEVEGLKMEIILISYDRFPKYITEKEKKLTLKHKVRYERRCINRKWDTDNTYALEQMCEAVKYVNHKYKRIIDRAREEGFNHLEPRFQAYMLDRHISEVRTHLFDHGIPPTLIDKLV